MENGNVQFFFFMITGRIVLQHKHFLYTIFLVFHNIYGLIIFREKSVFFCFQSSQTANQISQNFSRNENSSG